MGRKGDPLKRIAMLRYLVRYYKEKKHDTLRGIADAIEKERIASKNTARYLLDELVTNGLLRETGKRSIHHKEIFEVAREINILYQEESSKKGQKDIIEQLFNGKMSSQEIDKANELFNASLVDLEFEDYSKAIDRLYNAWELYPEHKEFCTNLGVQLKNRFENYETKGVILANGYTIMSAFLFMSGFQDDGFITLEKSADLFVDNKHCTDALERYYEIIKIYESINEPKKAIDCLMNAIIKSNSVGDLTILHHLYNYMANIYEEIGDYEKMADCMQNVIEYLKYDNFENDGHIDRIAWKYKKHKKYDKAIGTFLIALEHYTKNKCYYQGTECLIGIAEAYKENSEHEKAYNHLQNLMKCYVEDHRIQLQPDQLMHIADLYKEIGKPKYAVKCYQNIIDIYRTDKKINETSKYFEKIAEIYIATNELENAINNLKNAAFYYTEFGQYIESSRCYIQIADIYKNLGKTRRATVFLNKLLKELEISGHIKEELVDEFSTYPEETKYIRQVAEIYNDIGKHEKAIEMLQIARNKFINMDRNTTSESEAESLIRIAEIYRENGHPTEAIEYFENAADRFTFNFDFKEAITCYVHIADIYQNIKKAKEGITFLNEVIGEYPNLPGMGEIEEDFDHLTACYYKLSDMYIQTNQPERAIDCIQNAVNTYVKHSNNNEDIKFEYYLHLAQIYDKMDRIDNAVKYFSMIAEKQIEQDCFKEALKSYMVISDLYIKRKKYGMAEVAIRNSTKILINNSEYKIAAECFSKLLEIYTITTFKDMEKVNKLKMEKAGLNLLSLIVFDQEIEEDILETQESN